jgi:iron(III) transport system permease protein
VFFKSRIRPVSWIAILLLALAAALLFAADARSKSLAFNTLKLVAGTLAISLPVGSVLGLLIARTDLPLRRTAAAVLGLLLIVPLYLQAAAWQSGFGLFGWYTLAFGSPLQSPWLVGWRGAIFVHAVAAVPWVALIVGLASRQVEAQLEEAALLDASAWQVFRTVTLRRIWPAIGLAAIWVSLLAATDMTVTDLYQVRTYAEEVYTDFAGAADPSAPELGPLAGAAVVASLTAGAILLCAGAAQQSARLLPKQPLKFSLGRWRRPAVALVVIVLVILLGVPIYSSLYKAGVTVTPGNDGVARSWSLAKCVDIIAVSPERFKSEIGLSLQTAVGAASIAWLVSLPLSWMASSGGLAAAPALIVGALALAIPAPLLGVELIQLLDNPDIPWINGLYHTIAAPMIGQAIRALPLAMFIVWLAFRSIPKEQFEAAAIDGAGRWGRFWRVALPQRWPALIAAWLAAFVVTFNELPTTQLLQPPGPMTLPVAIYQLMHGSGEDRLAGIVLFMILAYAAIGATVLAIWSFANKNRH